MTIACPDCGALEDLPALPPGGKAVCVRCDIDLEKTAGRSIGAALACSLATLLLLFPVNVLPLLRVDLLGMQAQNVIAVGIEQLIGNEWVLLAGAAAVFVVALPFVRFGLLSVVLGALRLGHRPSWLGPALRWAMWLDLWAMLDVYLLAGGVGFYRLSNVSQAQISIEIGGMCFIAAALLTMLSRATLDPRTVWRTIGGETQANSDEAMIGCTSCDLVQPASCVGAPCPRCRATLRYRKRGAMSRTAAILVAAAILIFPANIYPMNISDQLGTQTGYTIFTGIRDLFESGCV